MSTIDLESLRNTPARTINVPIDGLGDLVLYRPGVRQLLDLAERGEAINSAASADEQCELMLDAISALLVDESLRSAEGRQLLAERLDIHDLKQIFDTVADTQQQRERAKKN